MQRAAGPYYAITERQVADSDSTLETAAASDAGPKPLQPAAAAEILEKTQKSLSVWRKHSHGLRRNSASVSVSGGDAQRRQSRWRGMKMRVPPPTFIPREWAGKLLTVWTEIAEITGTGLRL